MPYASTASARSDNASGMTAEEARRDAMVTCLQITSQAEDGLEGNGLRALKAMKAECSFLIKEIKSVSGHAVRQHLTWLFQGEVRKVSRMAGDIKMPLRQYAGLGLGVRFYTAGCDKPEPHIAHVPFTDLLEDRTWATLDEIVAAAAEAAGLTGDLVPLLVRK